MHIVLLGPRPEVIEELHGLGHTLTALYVEFSRHNAEKYADLLTHRGFIPTYDAPELAWSVLLHLGITEEVDVVIPCNELAVVTASLLNSLLGLTDRIGLRTAMAGRDKAFQKSLWAEHGVPTARYVTLTNTPRNRQELRNTVATLAPPFVVKPPSLGGSRLVRSCPTVDDVFTALDDDVEMRHAVVEEKQEGDEWHFDGVLVDGDVRYVMVSRYLAPLIETKHGKTLRSVAYPVHGHPELYAEAKQVAQSAADALNGRCGVFHLEVFGKPGGFTAGELAWRPAGVLAPLSAEHTIGLNLWSAHARVLSGEELPPPAPPGDGVVGFVCLPLRRGARNGVVVEDIEALPGVCHVQMLVKPGEIMGEMHASTKGVAMVLIKGSDVEECARLIDDAVELTNELHERKSA